MPGGGDWSGLGGHRCDVCGRSSSDVGPRRGFDYANSVCGGCCALSSDDDGHNKEGHCRKCKLYIYMKGGDRCAPCSTIDGYCADCCKICQFCSEDIHPKFAKRYSVPLDEAVKRLIDDGFKHGDFEMGADFSVYVLGEDAMAGEVVQLCKRCHGVWRRHPRKGKPFPGFTDEEREAFE